MDCERFKEFARLFQRMLPLKANELVPILRAVSLTLSFEAVLPNQQSVLPTKTKIVGNVTTHAPR